MTPGYPVNEKMKNITPKYLALGLRLGLCEPSDVQKWVNTEIEKQGIATGLFLELAFLKDSQVVDMYSILEKFDDSSDIFEVLRKLFEDVDISILEDIKFCKRLAECLEGIWIDNNYESPEEFAEIGFFDDGYFLASDGIGETPEQWHSSFIDFIKKFKINC